MDSIRQLFTEKFRPQNFNQLIAPPRIKNELSKGLVQNILLYGSPGTGKTSTLFILAKDHPTLYINASDERGIQTIRDRISKFCSTISLDGGKESLKCVILDEIDGATQDFYKALRAVMERYAQTTRFIASCNNINQIPDPVSKSRFNRISFDPLNKEEEVYLLKEYEKRVGLILDAAKISHDEKILKKFVKNEFPDLRSLMTKIQSLYLRGVKKLDEDNILINFDFKDLYELCLSQKPSPYENYKFIVNEYGSRIEESFVSLGEDFPEYLKKTQPDKIHKLPGAIIAIAEYQYQKAFAIDPLITLLALVFKLQQIFNS